MEHYLRRVVASFLTVSPFLFIFMGCPTSKLAPYKPSICIIPNAPDIVIAAVDRYDYICGNNEGVPDLTVISATIRNKGGNIKRRWFQTFPKMKVKIELSGNYFSISVSREVVVPFCLQDTQVRFEQAPGFTGPVKVRIVADYENSIIEGNEANNEIEIELQRKFPSSPMQCGGS